MATQALVAGDPPIVNIGTVVQAGLQGHDVVLIASSENSYNYSVVARPAIAKLEQLKGKRLGVSGFGSASHNASLILLKRFNLEAGQRRGAGGCRSDDRPFGRGGGGSDRRDDSHGVRIAARAQARFD